ncbi:uncharacterized protein LOC128218970 isoform X2 [Mya arenaria]|uniref:uncharacterized protein LOC128218970 isoform X2 n=1 Tax=Mya arenaria TaxID=6604 RepID=UPI0022E42AB3|nr:uncharacterized protein LOC128218970 isoform X2 [Mya arenaria]
MCKNDFCVACGTASVMFCIIAIVLGLIGLGITKIVLENSENTSSLGKFEPSGNAYLQQKEFVPLHSVRIKEEIEPSEFEQTGFACSLLFIIQTTRHLMYKMSFPFIFNYITSSSLFKISFFVSNCLTRPPLFKIFHPFV